SILPSTSEAIAYAGIKEKRGAVSRIATDNNVKLIISATKQEFNRVPTNSQVWSSTRHKDFTREVRNFLWKSVHSAHHIGTFWKHIPECEEHGICQVCAVPEDLEHILLKCKSPGQSQIWALAKELWLKKFPKWPELSLGGILGCGLATFTDDKGKSLPGASHLYRILISESLFTIWKVRNHRVISENGGPLSPNAIHSKWLAAINLHLRFDCALTNHAKYGKQKHKSSPGHADLEICTIE
ncbi:hypothetical protein B0H13DRAFT_1595499, partial [Mycena leptocephala]